MEKAESPSYSNEKEYLNYKTIKGRNKQNLLISPFNTIKNDIIEEIDELHLTPDNSVRRKIKNEFYIHDKKRVSFLSNCTPRALYHHQKNVLSEGNIVNKDINTIIYNDITFSTLNNNKINIKRIEKMTKCEQLKSEILLNEQRKHYSLKKSFEPIISYPQSYFTRNLKSLFNNYTPSFHINYNKNKTFKMKNIPTSRNKKKHIRLYKTYHNNNKNKNKKNWERDIDKVKQIHLDVYNKSQRIFNDIKYTQKMARSNSPSRERDEDVPSLLKNYKLYMSPKNNEIEMEKVLKDNANKVKLRLDEKSGRYVDQVVNQIIYEDEKLNREQNNHNEYESKKDFMKLNREFKKVGHNNHYYSKILHLENFFSPESQSEIKKMHKLLQRKKPVMMDIDQMKEEIVRMRVMRDDRMRFKKKLSNIVKDRKTSEDIARMNQI